MKAGNCCWVFFAGILAAGWPGLLAADGIGRQVSSPWLGPSAVSASPDGRTLYVACTDARQVLWVAWPAGRVVRRVDMPAPPTGLALTPGGQRLVVTCAAPQSLVAVLDSRSGQVLSTIPAGHTAMGPAISPDGRTLYVCNRFDNDVSVIDLAGGRSLARVPVVREPVDAALTPDGRKLVVANHLANMRTNVTILEEVTPIVTVIDTQSRSAMSVPLPNGAHSVRGVCVTPDGRYALVSHLLGNFQENPFRVDMGWINTNVVSLVELAGPRLLGTVGLDEMDLGAGNPWDVVCTPDGAWVAVSVSGTHQLAMIETSVLLSAEGRRTMAPMMGVWPIYLSLGSSLWKRVDLPGNGPRGLTAVGSWVFVAEYFTDTVTAVEVGHTTPATPVAIPLGRPPEQTLQRRGEMLFHDATLCYQHWQSCASCHPDGRSDALNWDLLNDGSGNPKNTRSLLLSHRTPPVMALGVRETAEVAVRAGIRNILFSNRPENEAEAIDAYLRSLKPVPSPHLVNGQLSAAARRGRRLFFSTRTGCVRCHPPPLYTDLRQHDMGTGGPYEPTAQFDTPTLVEVWRTAPYLHDGRYATIYDLLLRGHHGLDRRRLERLSYRDLFDLAEFVLSL